MIAIARALGRLVASLTPIWLVAVACSGSVHADGGAPCWSGRAGGYQVAVFQSPNPLRIGIDECSLLVQDAATRELLPAAQVTLRFAPRRQPGQIQSVEFSRQPSSNRLFQSALLQLPEAGWWEFELAIDGSLEPATAHFAAQVIEAPPRWLTFWPWFSWPAIAVVLFSVHQWLVSRGTATRR